MRRFPTGSFTLAPVDTELTRQMDALMNRIYAPAIDLTKAHGVPMTVTGMELASDGKTLLVTYGVKKEAPA